MSNCGYHCDDLTNAPVSRPSREAGQVLKIEVSRSDSYCDNDED